MRREDAIKQYGVNYTVDLDSRVILENLGSGKYFSNVPVTKEEAELSFSFNYLHKQLAEVTDNIFYDLRSNQIDIDEDEDSHDDEYVLDVSDDGLSALGYSQQGVAQKLSNLFVDALCFLSGDNHDRYSLDQIQHNIERMKSFIIEYADITAELEGGFEPQYPLEPVYEYEMLPDELNVTANPLEDNKEAYAVFISSRGHLSVGSISLKFNGLAEYKQMDFDGCKVSATKDTVILPTYQMVKDDALICSVQYIDGNQHAKLSDVMGSLIVSDTPTGVDKGAYNSFGGRKYVGAFLDREGVECFLNGLSRHQDSPVNTDIAYTQLKNL